MLVRDDLILVRDTPATRDLLHATNSPRSPSAVRNLPNFDKPFSAPVPKRHPGMSIPLSPGGGGGGAGRSISYMPPQEERGAPRLERKWTAPSASMTASQTLRTRERGWDWTGPFGSATGVAMLMVSHACPR